MLIVILAAVAATTPLPPPRHLRARDVQAIRKLAGNYCDPDVTGVSTHRLDARHTLGIVACTQGPYQGDSLIVVINEAGRWTPAAIEQPSRLEQGKDSFEAHLLDQAHYSESLLTTCYKARAMDDCDLAASWVWDGKRFRLVQSVGWPKDPPTKK
jgi:hypothetical protein